MTKSFDSAYRRILRETLVGSKIRNKKPGMGRKGGRQRDLQHARPEARQMQKHAAHIRPTHKVSGNETGVHSKRPDSKPVYSKNGIKPTVNKSQRTTKSKANVPYSSNHGGSMTKRNLQNRREKLLKDRAK